MKKALFSVVLSALAFASQAQWVNQPLGIGTPQLVYEMEAINNNVAWAVATDSVSEPGKAFFRTTDGGLTWTSGSIGGPQDFVATNITAIDGSTAWVAMAHDTLYAGHVRKTTDGGLTWTAQPTAVFAAPDGYADVIHFFDANNGVVFGDPNGGYWEIYTTTNGGTNWVRVPQANVPAALPGEFGMFAKATMGDTIWVGTSEGRILRSPDRGLTWTGFSTLLNGIQGIAFSDALNGIAMSVRDLVRTTDGGATWTSVNPSGPLFDYDLAPVPGRPGTFVSTGWDGISGFPGSSYTFNYGQDWFVIDSLPHMAVAFASPTAGWTSGSGDTGNPGLYRWTGTFLSAPLATAAQEEVQIWPNPSAGECRLSGAAAYRSLLITDALGRTVYSAADLAGQPVYRLQLGHLPKGLYLVRLHGNRGSRQQKLVLH